MPIKGGCIAIFEHSSKKIKARLLIVDKSVKPILGLQTCEMLNLVKRVYVVSTQPANDHDSLMEYSDCFSGLRCLPGEHKIQVDESVTTVVHPCWKIPFKLRGKLKEELVHMEKLGVIKKIDETTAWVSSLVAVEKPKGKLQTCLDYASPTDPNSKQNH